MNERPTNVLLVFADQMRGQAMGCAGNRQVRTPNLDRLADQGTRFTHAYCNSPVCTPSRGSLLTGLYPSRHGAYVNDIPIRTDLPSMGTIFRDAGYATGYVGKWHLDGVPRDKFTPPGPRRLDFDRLWAVHNCTHDYLNSFYYADSPKPIPIDGYEPQQQTQLAIEFIESHRDRPFCLVLSWGPPHDPYSAVPERFKRLYDPSGIELRPNVPPEKADESRRDIAGYYAHVTALDASLGRLLDKLDELNLSENTLVVFTSDHGDMLGSQGQIRKQRPWEESISVPLIVRKPGQVPPGRTSDALISIVDLLPTILGLCGLDGDSGMQGRDLSQTVTGTDDGEKDVLLTNPCPIGQFRRSQARQEVLLANPCPVDDYRAMRGWWGLRTRHHTYARRLDGTWVLYDNDADPYQMSNLAEDTDYADLRQELDGRLTQRLEEVGELMLPWDELIRRLDMVEQWNARERELQGDKGRFL